MIPFMNAEQKNGAMMVVGLVPESFLELFMCMV